MWSASPATSRSTRCWCAPPTRSAEDPRAARPVCYSCGVTTDPAALVVTEARLRSGAVVDVHCAAGRVVALAPTGSLAVPPGATTVQAGGGLVTEPLVDAHLHLDKVRTL